MAPEQKLSDADVRSIRRRVRVGAHQTDLAVEYGVNRKTIRRRLTELEREERDRAARLAEKRLRQQAARERRKLRAREEQADTPVPAQPSHSASHQKRPPVHDPYIAWLDRPKNLSGRALAEANGLVRLARGGDRRWIDRSEVDTYFEAGWVLEDGAG